MKKVLYNLIIFSIIIFSLSFNVSGASYYFSSQNGNDENNGLSSDSPWKTMEKLRQILPNLVAGDIVYFEKGSVWENVNLNLTNLTGNAINPIMFKSYGAGNKPVFYGSKSLISFTQNGNIWRLVDNELPDYITDYRRVAPYIYINNQRFEPSRYPNVDNLNTNTVNVKNYLEDFTQNWQVNEWVNGLLVAKTYDYSWHTKKILSNSNNRLNFESFDGNFQKSITPYFISNHLNACDIDGEWAQQNDTLWIYNSSDLNSMKIEIPVSDTIFKINNCQNLIFEDLEFGRSIIHNICVRYSSIEIKKCKFSDSGGGLIYAYRSTLNINESNFLRGRRGGIYLFYCNGLISSNNFTDMAFSGPNNTEEISTASLLNWYCTDVIKIEHNSFIGVNIAIHNHWSWAPFYIEENYISDYGITLNDVGAIYIGTDATYHTKIVKKNIIENSHNTLVHAIYLDAGTANVVVDSNTLINSNIPVHIHVSNNNEIKNNIIFNPSLNMAYPWNTAFKLDELSYHSHGEGNLVQNNSIHDNNIILGTAQNESSMLLFGLSQNSYNSAYNNNIFNLFSTNDKIFLKANDYSWFNSYTLEDWKNLTGLESNSLLNKNQWTFQNVTGIDQNDFVLFLTNPTDKDSVFDVRSLGRVYMDIEGNIIDSLVTILPFYSVPLFYFTDNPNYNHPPVVSNKEYTIYESGYSGTFIGSLNAIDQDLNMLTYTIISGNTGSVFRVDNSGDIHFSSSLPNYDINTTYNLVVRVTDDGAPSLSKLANVRINIIIENFAPNISNQTFEVPATRPLNAWIAKVIATDPNPGQVLNFAITAGNSANLFSINQYDGNLYFTNTSMIFTTNTSYNIAVQVTDNGNPSYSRSASIRINVNIVNLPPTINNQTFNVNVSIPLSTFIGKVQASDPNNEQTISYSITDGNTGSIFRIDAATGNLYFTSSSTTFSTNSSYTLTIHVSDNATPSPLTKSALITINIIVGNNTPVINNQTFSIEEQYPVLPLIGRIQASDPDFGQYLTFSIISAYPENIFHINQNTGDLYFNSPDNISFIGSPQFQLTIQVSDNGNPIKSKTALISVNLVQNVNAFYINPNITDPQENGTIYHPYNSWSDVQWIDGYKYLQKASTSTEIDVLNINADNVFIGSYGSGTKPLINSESNNYIIRILYRHDITIKNLSIQADNAISCIYSVGSNNDNIKIENCEFINTSNGIRITGGDNFILSESKFTNNIDGVISFAKTSKIYYNIFENNSKAINILDSSSKNEISNNVFYDNIIGINSSAHDMKIFNNIFNLISDNTKAFSLAYEDFQSDNNIFYPDRNGFISVNGNTLSSLTEYQNNYLKDQNSLNQDPTFDNSSSLDYSITLNSPALNSGTNLGHTFDFFGNQVPIGDAPDIGVHELDITSSIVEPIIENVNDNYFIYPNPSEGDITLSIKNGDCNGAVLKVRTITGSIIFSEKIFLIPGTVTLNLKENSIMNKGIYFIFLEKDNAIIFVNKLVIF